MAVIVHFNSQTAALFTNSSGECACVLTAPELGILSCFRTIFVIRLCSIKISFISLCNVVSAFPQPFLISQGPDVMGISKTQTGDWLPLN